MTRLSETLTAIHEAADGFGWARPADAAAVLGTSPGALGRRVSPLVEEGLVMVRPGRKRRWRLTYAAKRIVEEPDFACTALRNFIRRCSPLRHIDAAVREGREALRDRWQEEASAAAVADNPHRARHIEGLLDRLLGEQPVSPSV